MTLEVLLSKASFVLGSLWKLRVNIDGFKSENSDELVTQASIGRSFQLLDSLKIDFNNKLIIDRVQVRLLEDDYICWFKFSELTHNASKIDSWKSEFLTEEKIFTRIPKILAWAKAAKKTSNEYLWGGTTGPNFDCSGFVQSAFASSGIWIPRDAYQQEKFCKNVSLNIESLSEKLIPGDLIFFGSSEKCTHVGLHIENGFYIHSSGVSNGHNGIEIDGLFHPNLGKIASFYRSQFRSAGRVISCYQSGKL
ncbi:C40 family peptidase [Prochlorococcus marinus]|uniref:NlpC/P60 family protein n=1 Tax=Prochlorococcus marinus XMU1408 TaxID=2213228 RepID=A0A318QZP6_PROMR|nr:C40 family peptidase [Prochlorococcus marinus]MBW3042738.1 NlpC/P60 family protein [Prochlorococcus marinus str. XMU1408]PYE01424.1 NlpC/P60 family protein [Prochlorococcus marinus XMU1408]